MFRQSDNVYTFRWYGLIVPTPTLYLSRKRMDVSLQVKAIERNANIIAMLISGNLTLIANDLRELLDDLDYSRIVNTTATPPLERAIDLIQCVITHIKVDPAKYEIFYSVIKKYRTLQALLKKLPEPDGELVL